MHRFLARFWRSEHQTRPSPRFWSQSWFWSSSASRARLYDGKALQVRGGEAVRQAARLAQVSQTAQAQAQAQAQRPARATAIREPVSASAPTQPQPAAPTSSEGQPPARPSLLRRAADLIGLTELTRILPRLPTELARRYLPYLNEAMREVAINTPRRIAAFIGQLGHESKQLTDFVEDGSGRRYEGRRDLGNTQPGDGERYKGRGPIQLTGRANYRAAGRAIGVDLEAHPERADDPDVAFRIAAWYWESRGINRYADRGDVVGVTRRINGGTNGLSERRELTDRALDVL